jgi:hypothetical protein
MVKTSVPYQGNPFIVNTSSDEISKRGSHNGVKLHPNSKSLLQAQISSWFTKQGLLRCYRKDRFISFLILSQTHIRRSSNKYIVCCHFVLRSSSSSSRQDGIDTNSQSLQNTIHKFASCKNIYLKASGCKVCCIAACLSTDGGW